MKKEKKERREVWFYPSVWEEIVTATESDNCKSPSEFLEKAAKFYLGYLKQEENIDYLSPMITRTVDSTIAGTEQRMNAMMFKMAVEIGKLSNLFAAINCVDKQMLSDLQRHVEQEIKRINGVITLENAYEFQKE